MTRWRLIVSVLFVVAIAGCLGDGSGQAATDPADTLPNRFTVEKLPYDSVSQFRAINDTPTYIAWNESGEYLIHGETIIAHASNIVEYRWADGSWAYITVDGERWYLHVNGERRGPYDVVAPPVRVGESWAYGVSVNGTGKLLLKGVNVAAKYSFRPWDYTVVDGDLAYAATVERTNEKVVVHDGSEVARGEEVNRLVDTVNGELLYMRTERGSDTSEEKVIVYGGRRIRTEAPFTLDYTGVNSSLYYAVPQDTESGVHVYQHPEEESYGPYSGFDRIMDVDDRPAFILTGSSSPAIVYRGKRYGTAYDYIDELSVTDVNGTLTYRAGMETEDGTLEWRHIVYGTEEIGQAYDITPHITDVGGKLAFIAKHDENFYIVREQ